MIRSTFVALLVLVAGCAPPEPQPPSALPPDEAAHTDPGQQPQGAASAPAPEELAVGAPVRGLEAVPVIANPLTLAVEWNPAGSRSLRAVREVKVVAHAIGAEPVVLELVTPSGAVFFRREAAASDAGLTLLVAGTVVEQRQLWGAWTVVARQGSRRTQVGFELER